ncbi:MAG: hypothetical protein JRG72_00880 [Deltaproteobacteria bacterium]|nr:hypothetical protein [Deltaproteobacteria bacterium]
MNPFLAMLSVILGLKRTCPQCHRDQIVPARDRPKAVKCKFCGAAIPPRRS